VLAESVGTLIVSFVPSVFKRPRRASPFPDVDAGNRVKQPNAIQQPQNDCNDHDTIQN
jgi:hypothetical protein